MCIYYILYVYRTSVRLGEYDTDTLKDWDGEEYLEAIEIAVATLIPHKYYKPINYENDIGLILLEKPVTFGRNIRPICLPTNDYQTKSTDILTAVGWGRTETSKHV